MIDIEIYKEIADCVLSVLDNELGEEVVKELIEWEEDLPRCDVGLKRALLDKIEYSAKMYDRCCKCGNKLSNRKVKQKHSELDGDFYETMYEKYCPNCGYEE